MDRRILLLIAIIALVGALGVGLAYQLRGARPSEPPAVGGPFRLVDQNGREVDQRILDGKWSLVFFGFTHCPDVCPTTLFTLAETEDLLGPKAKDLQTVFISVDPERDTPEQVKAYLANDAFPRRTIGLTGSPAQVSEAAKAYRVYFQKAGEGPDYSVDHTTPTYLMNPRGRFVCVIPHGVTPEQAAERVSKAMREGRSAQSC